MAVVMDTLTHLPTSMAQLWDLQSPSMSIMVMVMAMDMPSTML